MASTRTTPENSVEPAPVENTTSTLSIPPGPRPDAEWQEALQEFRTASSSAPTIEIEKVCAWYLVRWRAGLLPREALLPDLTEAFDIWQDGPPVRSALEALLLTSISFQEIATRLKLNVTVVCVYEHLFFHVRPQWSNPKWIRYYAIYKEGLPPLIENEILLRYFAYYCGRMCFEIVWSILWGEGLEQYTDKEIRVAKAAMQQVPMPEASPAPAVMEQGPGVAVPVAPAGVVREGDGPESYPATAQSGETLFVGGQSATGP